MDEQYIKVIKKYKRDLKHDLTEIAKFLTTSRIKHDRLRINIFDFLTSEILRISEIIKGFDEVIKEDKIKRRKE